jgi:hypothetical protein
LAHSRAYAFGRATFLALLGLATRLHPRRTEGVPGLGVSSRTLMGHPCRMIRRVRPAKRCRATSVCLPARVSGRSRPGRSTMRNSATRIPIHALSMRTIENTRGCARRGCWRGEEDELSWRHARASAVEEGRSQWSPVCCSSLVDWPVYPRLANTTRASNDARCGARRRLLREGLAANVGNDFRRHGPG